MFPELDQRYRVVVGMTLMDCHRHQVCVERVTYLPFVPTAGIEMGWLDRHHNDWSGEVFTVIWSDHEQCFHVEMEDWVCRGMDLDEMIAELGPAWRRLGQARVPVA